MRYTGQDIHFGMAITYLKYSKSEQAVDNLLAYLPKQLYLGTRAPAYGAA